MADDLPEPDDASSAMPTWLRSPTAMWIFTLLCPGCILLGGFDVAKFHVLWHEDWQGIVAVTAVGLGSKHLKDWAMAKVQNGK